MELTNRSTGEYLVEARGIVKIFPGVIALKGVDFALRSGEVHALLGENGAGKSTLIKVLSGVYARDAGTVFYEGVEGEFASTKEAQDWGISVIHQELKLCPSRTVAENIFMGREKLKGVILDDRSQNEAAREALAQLGATWIDPAAEVSSLTVSAQQLVEIAKALCANARVLIMDEPTSSLTTNEIQYLFNVIRRLRGQGVGIVYISHRLEELSQIVDRVSIYRDGEYIATHVFNSEDMGEYIHQMVGREVKDSFPRMTIPRGELKLQVRGVERTTGRKLKKCSFDAYAGEILAIAGLDGAGRTELARAVFGADQVEKMELLKDGRPIRVRNVRDAVRNGIAYVPEDRKFQGLALAKSVGENTTLAALDKASNRFGVIKKAIEMMMAMSMTKQLKIKTPSLHQEVGNLSGGNQQKVVVGKWLLESPDVLIFDEPTRGIDIGAKIEIYNILNELKSQGKAIIVISSELPEVLGISDRVIVMCDGAIKTDLETRKTSQEEIMHYATRF